MYICCNLYIVYLYIGTYIFVNMTCSMIDIDDNNYFEFRHIIKNEFNLFNINWKKEILLIKIIYHRICTPIVIL